MGIIKRRSVAGLGAERKEVVGLYLIHCMEGFTVNVFCYWFLAEKIVPRKPTRFSCLLPTTQELIMIKNKKKVWSANSNPSIVSRHCMYNNSSDYSEVYSQKSKLHENITETEFLCARARGDFI